MAYSNRKRVAVMGWYGHGNFGDGLLLEGLKQLFADWEILVFSDNQKSSFPMIDFNAVNTCDLFVLGGGELINTDRLFIHSPWVHNIKIPKIILGCGVNAETPSDLSRKVVDALEQFSYIGVRDHVAESALKSIPQLKDKTYLFFDLAFQVKLPCYRKSCLSNTAIVIPTDRHHNRFDKGIRETDLVKKSRKWLKQTLLPYDNTVFIPFGTEDNNDYYTAVKMLPFAKCSSVLEPNLVDLQNVCRLFSESSLVVSYRLHGLILAHILGVKYQFYPYHWKLKRVYETIRDLPPSTIRNLQTEQFKKALNEAKNL